MSETSPDFLRSLPFRVAERLGAGAFAEVYRVEVRGARAVMKLARPEPLSEAGATGGVFFAQGREFHTGSSSAWRPSPNEVLETEERVLGRIRHPAFVKPIAVPGVPGAIGVSGVTKGRRYLLLEEVEGTSWRAALRSEKPPGLPAFLQVVEALAAAHASGELPFHGDLKPENLMVGPDGRVRLLDPTSGCMVRDGSGSPLRLLTTSCYNPCHHASDVFALGVLLIEILTGEHPLLSSPPAGAGRWVGPRLQWTLRAAQATGRCSPYFERLASMKLPRDVRPGLPEQLERAALRCLGVKRERAGLESDDAFASPAELAQALRPG